MKGNEGFVWICRGSPNYKQKYFERSLIRGRGKTPKLGSKCGRNMWQQVRRFSCANSWGFPLAHAGKKLQVHMIHMIHHTLSSYIFFHQYGSLEKIGLPQNGWVIMENSIKHGMIWVGFPTIFGNINIFIYIIQHVSFRIHGPHPFSTPNRGCGLRSIVGEGGV